MIRIGQIGIGHNHGAARMQTLRKFPELFEIVGYAPESDDWQKKRGSLPAYEGIPRLTAEEIIEKSDAVLVETQISLLTATAQKCVDAGKHVLMDKPAGGTLEEFGHLLQTAKEKNLVLQLGYMYRYNPAVKKCLELLDSGELGEIYAVNAEMSAHDPVKYRQWLSQFPGGGMYIFGSHLLDLVIRILGKPEKVHTFYKQSGLDGVAQPDQGLAVLEYPRAMAKIYTSAVEVNGFGRRQLMVSGSKGTVDIVPLERPCRMTWSDRQLATQVHDDRKVEIPVEDLPRESRYDEEFRCFHDYVTGAKKDPWSYEHNYLVQEVLTQIVGGCYGKNTD